MADRGRRVREIFDQAAELAPEGRGGFVEERCAGDEALRAEVESLLACMDGDAGFLEGTPFSTSPSLAARMGLRVPERFGRYRLIRLVGEGGMGAVYEAEQENPRRRVALKVVYPAFASGQLLRRFEHEAHVLGQLKHPGIGQIYEAGWEDTPYGRQPYFAMEFVSGTPLTEHAERAGLSVRERLELMAKVCDAIEHAHQKGVIHRDLKPANILVEEVTESGDDRPGRGPRVSAQPKILDFGIARMTDSDMRYVTVQTNVGQLLGTVPYMSPEQVSGDPSSLDARSDVYALGVILYELLAHRLPYELGNRPLPEIARVIREEEPRTLAGVDPALAGDVSTIVGKALQKERERRYQSASELGADLRRHLSDQPIAARPPTTMYQLQKFARRNRALVAGVAAAFVTLVAAVVVVTALAVRESQLRRVADENAAAARRLAYRTSLAAAAAALDKHQRGALRARLDEAPEELRGWEWRYLDSLFDRSVGSVQLEEGELLAGFDGAGGAVLTVTPGGRVRVWGSADGREASHAELVEGGVTSAALSPDGRTLVAATASGRATAVDTEDWQARWSVAGLAPRSACVFSDDGRFVAMALADLHSVGVFDGATGEALRTVGIGLARPMPLAFSPGGRSMFALDEPNTLEVDLTTGERRNWPRADILRVSRDGGRVCSQWGPEPTVQDWASMEVLATLRGVTGPVTSWVLSPAREMAALGERSGWVTFRDLDDGEAIGELCAHDDAVQSMAFSADGARLATLDRRGVMTVWEGADEPVPVRVAHSNDNMNAGAFSADGGLFATVGWGSVKLWDARTGAERWLRTVAHPRVQGGALAFSPDGAGIAAALRTPGVWIFDVASAEHHVVQGDDDRLVDVVSWTRDGSRLLVARGGADIEVVEAATGRTSGLLRRGAGAARARCLASSADGTVIALGAEDGSVWVWRGGSETPERLGSDQGAPVLCLAFSGADDRLATGSEDGTVRVRGLSEPGRAGITSRLTSGVWSLDFHPDGSRLLAAASDGHVHVLRAEDGDDLLVLDCQTDAIIGARFGPDGEGVVACGPRIGMAIFDPAGESGVRAERRRIRAAREWVDRAFEAERASTLAGERLRADPSIPPELRDLCLQMAVARGDQPNWLNSRAWGAVQYPGQARESYAHALQVARAAAAVMPEYANFLNTLGVAQYRMELYAEAGATFERCTELRAVEGLPPSPFDTVFQAMAYGALGRRDDALRLLEQTRALMTGASAAESDELMPMLREAELALGIAEPGG